MDGNHHDTVVHKFTGKERDTESNLDNFGARYFSSSQGRFISPDPDNAGASNENLHRHEESWGASSRDRIRDLSARAEAA